VDRVAKLAVKKAQASETFDPGLKWSAFLAPVVAKVPAKKVPAKKAAKKVAKKAAKKG
jgi:hypothetical protein